jgi:hypothetical protein
MLSDGNKNNVAVWFADEDNSVIYGEGNGK